MLNYLTGDHTVSAELRSSGLDLSPGHKFVVDTKEVPVLSARESTLFPQLHLTPSFPPTVLVHGENDSAVPVAESAHFAKRLEELGVPAKLVVVPDAEHSFDYDASRQFDGHLAAAFPFLDAHVV